VTLAEIQQQVLASRGGAHGSWPWTRKMLARADEQFGGVWRAVQLPVDAVHAVILPPHAGEPCRGDQLTLVGAAGARVSDAAAMLTGLGDAYARNNPSCAERLALAREAPFSAVVLTPAPLQWEEYAGVMHVPGALYCVDGFHRLVAWASAGRLQPGVQIPTLMAGVPGAPSDPEYVPATQTGR
jgi:hypothetical protein